MLGERPGGEPHRLDHVAQVLGRIHRRQLEYLRRVADRPRDLRPVARGECEAKAERLEGEQDVGEQDRRVHAEPLHWLERDLRGELGPVAQLQE